MDVERPFVRRLHSANSHPDKENMSANYGIAEPGGSGRTRYNDSHVAPMTHSATKKCNSKDAVRPGGVFFDPCWRNDLRRL